MFLAHRHYFIYAIFISYQFLTIQNFILQINILNMIFRFVFV
jgi:hypothetical protein